MKYLLLSILLALTGCQSATPDAPLPQPPKPVAAPIAMAPAAPVASPLPLEEKVRQQAQYIEALLNQNDALSARLATPVAPTTEISVPVMPAPATKPAPVPAPAGTPAVANPVPVEPAPESPLVPNADGVIDLAAATVAAKPGETVNPFAIRSVAADAVREITVQVSGIIAGPTPCAVLNGRLVQAGETVESLTVERVDSDAVLVRHSGHLLRLPVSEKPVRLRLPL